MSSAVWGPSSRARPRYQAGVAMRATTQERGLPHLGEADQGPLLHRPVDLPGPPETAAGSRECPARLVSFRPRSPPRGKSRRRGTS
jgi:hypothetical protein